MCVKGMFAGWTTVSPRDIGPVGPDSVPRPSWHSPHDERGARTHAWGHARLVVPRQQHLGTLIVHTTTAGTSVLIDQSGKVRRIRVEGDLSTREPRAWASDHRKSRL